MKRKSLAQIISGACLFTMSLTAVAGPLLRSDVSAQPSWLVHLDFDGLRPTVVGQYILGELQKPEAQEKLEVFHNLFSFDLRTQLHGVTVYGAGSGPENGVLLVYADFDPEKLLTLAKSAEDHQSTNHNQHVIHNWVDSRRHSHGGDAPRTYAALQGQRVVIFGQREAAVAAALDVMDNVSANLSASQTFAQLGGEGTFILAAARNLDLPGSDPHAAILRLSKQVRFQAGESQRKLTASLTLEAADEEVAGHISSIAQGLMALIKLQKEKPEAVKLADALALKQEGTSVVGTLTLPVDDIIAILKGHTAQQEK